MNNTNNQNQVEEQKGLSPTQNIVKGDKYRFTILTPRLVRLEYNKDGYFIDNPSSLAINRNLGINNYNVTESNILLEIKTQYFTLTYVKNKPFKVGKIAGSSTLKVVLNDTDREWYYDHPEARNFGACTYDLEKEGPLKLDKGLYSLDGFASIDDSNTLILENGSYIKRPEGGTDIYLFMYKRDFGLCLDDYYHLTGYPASIPRYALGPWWYKNDRYTAPDIADVVKKFSDEKLPVSVFLLGDKWHTAPNNYQIDPTILGSGIEVAKYLKQNNIALGLTIDPSLPLTPEDPNYAEINKYIQTSGPINLTPMDMTKLTLYINNIISPLQKVGVSFFNIDYNNEKDKNTLWLLGHYHYQKSHLILTRNAGIAPHRYPITYTGKTKISWNTLSILPYYNLSCANIGLSWIAHAIGGFHNGIENPELYIRYIQFGVFSPIFLLASETGKYYKREPWKWNSLIQSVIKKYMILRNSLVPYLFSEGHKYTTKGITLIKPLYYENPKIYDEPNYKSQYYFTDQILVSPITKKKNPIMNRVVQKLYIPNGLWYDFFTGKKYHGDKYYSSFYKDEDYPVFCKAGTILPLSLDNTTSLPQNMEITIFPGASNTYELYEEVEGRHLLTIITYTYEKNKYTLNLSPKEGMPAIIGKRNYTLRFKNIKLTTGITVTSSGTSIGFTPEADHNDLLIKIKEISGTSILNVVITGENIEITTERVINEEIESILEDLEIETSLKEKIDSIIFSNLSIKKKRIAIRKLKRKGLESKFITMFISLLEYIEE